MSERPKYQSQIEERIMSYPYGTAFSASDFLDVADANSVSQALFRMEKEGKIRRVINGVYDKPAYSQIIQEHESYYPVNDKKNGTLYEAYKKLAYMENKVVFGGRLGEYKYYDMDQVIYAALAKAGVLLQ